MYKKVPICQTNKNKKILHALGHFVFGVAAPVLLPSVSLSPTRVFGPLQMSQECHNACADVAMVMEDKSLLGLDAVLIN